MPNKTKTLEHPTIAQLAKTIAQLKKENASLKEHIDKAWFGIEHEFNVESRQYFEENVSRIGFGGAPLAMAVHHIWKRDPQVANLEAKITRLIEAARHLIIHAENEPTMHPMLRSAITNMQNEIKKPVEPNQP